MPPINRIRLTQRRSKLIEVRQKSAQRIKAKIMPILQSRKKSLIRQLRRTYNLRKILGKIEVPAGEFAAPYRVHEFFKAPSPPPDPNADRDNWKKAFLLALLLGMSGGVDDIGNVENEIWASRGYSPLTFDANQIIQDYQFRNQRNLSEIPENLQGRVESTVADWYGTDAPFSDLIDELDGLFDESYADMIAQTEVGNITSQIFYQEMLSNNWSFWYWDAMGENPCQKPLEINGQVYDGCLDLNGRKFKRGDPMPPGAAHPNCLIPGQEVMVPNLSGGIKSFYDGVVIEFTTDGGRKLTVTPHHPILSAFGGWKSANLFNKGDYLVAHLDPQRVFYTVDPYNHTGPAPIEDIFESLKMTGGMTTRAMPASAEDFNGDARSINGNIEIVYPDWILRENMDSALIKKINQNLLTLIRWSSFIDSKGLTNSIFPPSFHSAYRVVSGLSESVALVGGVSGVSLELGFAPRPSLDSVFFQYPKHDAAADSIGLRDFLFRNAASIFLDKIVNVKEIKFTGHVYDLSSDFYELYISNGVITHNCQCLPTPAPA